MDHTDTALAVMRRHQPHPVWAFFGVNRCRSCRFRWPCNSWHNARDQRDRVLDLPAIARMMAVLRDAYGDTPPKGPRP